jgi:hypothetical protein
VEAEVARVGSRVTTAQDLVPVPGGDDVLFRNSDVSETGQAELVRVTREEILLAAVDVIDVLVVVGELDSGRPFRSGESLRGVLGKSSDLFGGLLDPSIIVG